MGNHGQTALAEAFAALVGPQVGDEDIDLIRASLTIARTEYPDLDIESYVARIDELAHMAEARISDVGDAIQTIAALNHILFDEAGLRGNREEYYDPRNCFLNDVLDRGLGIPITLALIYMEVGRRLGRKPGGTGPACDAFGTARAEPWAPGRGGRRLAELAELVTALRAVDPTEA